MSLMLVYVVGCTCTGNHMYATIHSKHTECRAVMDSVRRSTDRAIQPVEASMLDQCSDETIKRKLNDYDLSEMEKLNIVQLLDAKVRLCCAVIYALHCTVYAELKLCLCCYVGHYRRIYED
jgi:hypothetical protein